jgi:hypothetical protein
VIKPLTHINPLIKASLLVALLCIHINGSAQEDTATVPFNIESIVEDEVVEEQEADKFQTVSDYDLVRVVQRSIDSAKIAQLKKDDDFWYVNEVPPKKAAKPATQKEAPKILQDQTWIRNVLWVLVVGGFVSILIWFLIASNVKLLRKPQSVSAQQEDEDEMLTENIFDIDYEGALKKAIAVSNYRLAIRLLYLQTLKDLAIRNQIQYKQERTNNDYLMQLFQTAFYKDFFRLTRSFEYTWYGQFPVSPDVFASIQQEFSSFKQKLS